MKQFFLFIAIVSITNHVLCMDSFLKKIAGERVTTCVLRTDPQQQEPPLQVANNSDQDILLQATYACKVQFLYASIRNLGYSTMQSFEGVTNRNDRPVKCNGNQTITLIPELDTLAKSKVRLTGLKFCLVSEPNSWISVPLSTLSAARQQSQFIYHLDPTSK